MNTYKITITHTVEDNYRLIFNKKDLKKLIAKFDYIQKAVLTHKNYISKEQVEPEKRQSLEFICESLNSMSENQFINFIEAMHSQGFYSSNNNTIALIDLNNNYKVIFNYNFESLTKQPIKKNKKNKNRSTYQTQILYTKPTI